MALSFSTSPQVRFYSYLEDGHIYTISQEVPTEKKGKTSGYWFCYFRTNPYHKVGNAVYPIYISTGTSSGQTQYAQVSSSNWYTKGNVYYYLKDQTYTKIAKTPTVYYHKNGNLEYTWPNDSSELPQVSDGESVRYFDTLITNGDVYNVKLSTQTKFTATESIDIESGVEISKTYGDILLRKVKDSLSISNFTEDVNSLPSYLKKPIEDIGYNVDDNYFSESGELLIDLITEQMQEYGESLISSSYKNKINIASKVEGADADTTGTITISYK